MGPGGGGGGPAPPHPHPHPGGEVPKAPTGLSNWRQRHQRKLLIGRRPGGKLGQGDVQWAKETCSGPRRRAVGQGDVQWAKEKCTGPMRRAVGQGDVKWAKETCTGSRRRAVGQGGVQWARSFGGRGWVGGHKGGLLKRTDVHHRLSYNHKFFTSVHACAVQSHRLHVSPSWLGCSTIYVHYQKNQGAWQTHVCHVAVCMGYPIAGEVPRASVEAPWTPASLVPGSNSAARAARSGSSGAAARAKASNGWGGSLPWGVGGGGAHCCRRLGTFF